MKINREMIVEYLTPFQEYHPWAFSYEIFLFGPIGLFFRFQWGGAVLMILMYAGMTLYGAPIWKFFILNLIVAAGANAYRNHQLQAYLRKHPEEEE